MACFVSGGNSSIELAWEYRDNLAFNHDRASWLTDMFKRPEVPCREGVPEYVKAGVHGSGERTRQNFLSPGTVALFPQHSYETIPKLRNLKRDGSPTRVVRKDMPMRNTTWAMSTMTKEKQGPPRSAEQWKQVATGHYYPIKKTASAPSLEEKAAAYIDSGYLRDRDFTKWGSIQGEF
jgi:hypothetical protein